MRTLNQPFVVQRVKVLDEGDVFVIASEAYNEQHPLPMGTSAQRQTSPEMFSSDTGLYVQSSEDEKTWTMYPWHTVLWVETRNA